MIPLKKANILIPHDVDMTKWSVIACDQYTSQNEYWDKVKEIVNGVLEHKEEIDNIISLYSTKRTISRIPKVSLAILRIAVYEALYDELTPVNAAISEAVLLSQAFSYKEDTGFVNGVLSSFAKNISEEKSLNA